MLRGTGTVDDAVRVDVPAREPLELPGADVLQVIYEISATHRDELLPPALHPVNPPCVAWSFLRAPVSVHGPFTLADTRVLCRSGMRTRGYHVGGFVDNDAVADVLASQWGYRLTQADVSLDRRYHGTTGRVVVGDEIVLETGHHRPLLISAGDLQYTASMHLAELDRGVRLLQVERAFTFGQAERGTPMLGAFKGDARIRPLHPVSASSATADVTLKPIRFACRVDVSAFEGTETLTR